MRVIRWQNLQALRARLQQIDPGNIVIRDFDMDALEKICNSLMTERDASSKGESDKLQDKLFIWNDNIFNIGIWIKKYKSR